MLRIALCACLTVLGLAGCHDGTTSPAAAPTAEPARAKTPQAATEPKPAAPPTTQPATPTTAPVYDQGPLRIDISAMREIRLKYLDSAERSAAESNFAIQVRVQGERLKEVSRHGSFILTEIVDDTGQSLIDPKADSEEDKTTTRRLTVPPERLREAGLQLVARAKMAPRESRLLKKVRGTIHLILADKAEKYTILNPLQYADKTIDDARLKALGVEVRLVPAGEFEQPVPEGCIVLHFKTKPEYIQGVTFYDGWMRPLAARERQLTTTSGQQCTGYCFQGNALDNEMQLVLEVYSKVEDIQLPLEADNVPLP